MKIITGKFNPFFNSELIALIAMLLLAFSSQAQKVDQLYPCTDSLGNRIENCMAFSTGNGTYTEVVQDSIYCENDSTKTVYVDAYNNEYFTTISVPGCACCELEQTFQDTSYWDASKNTLVFIESDGDTNNYVLCLKPDCVIDPEPTPFGHIETTEPDPSTGTVNAATTSLKPDSTTVMPCDECGFLEVLKRKAGTNDPYVIHEIVENLTGATANQASTNNPSETILDHIPGTDVLFDCSGITYFQFDKKGWATANDYNYRAIEDGIQDTTNLDIRHNAQDLIFIYKTGGQCDGSNETCPVVSSNTDNVDTICSLLFPWGGSIRVNLASNAPLNDDLKYQLKFQLVATKGVRYNHLNQAYTNFSHTVTPSFNGEDVRFAQPNTEAEQMIVSFDSPTVDTYYDMFVSAKRINGLYGEVRIPVYAVGGGDNKNGRVGILYHSAAWTNGLRVECGGNDNRNTISTGAMNRMRSLDNVVSNEWFTTITNIMEDTPYKPTINGNNNDSNFDYNINQGLYDLSGEYDLVHPDHGYQKATSFWVTEINYGF